VYGFSSPSIQHVCDNKSYINATWKDENISVFDKTKPDADVTKVARNAIADIQQYYQVNAFWVEGHADKRGPPLSPQEELNILMDALADKAQTPLPTYTDPRPDCLHFPEQQISIVIQQRKVTSRLPYHISNAIHGPELTKYLSEKEKWTPLVYRSIVWDSFNIAFNKLTTARQIVTSKTLYSCWCTNTHNKRDRGQHKEFCLCVHEGEDWCHVLTCQGTGAIIFRTGSWLQLRTSMNKWKIHKDIWTCFDHGLSHFSCHPLKDDTSSPTTPFGPSLRVNHGILNTTAATQSHIGWPTFLKGRISNEWAKLWAKSMGLLTSKACECALIQALRDHI
jgi:hypothetical protein